MSRVLLVGMGVPGLVQWQRHAGPGLRAAHFASALISDNHEVLLLAVLGEHEAVPTAATAPVHRVAGPGNSEYAHLHSEDACVHAEGVHVRPRDSRGEDFRGETGRAEPLDGGEMPGLTIEYTTEREMFSRSMRERLGRFAPQAVVGVTVYAAALAVRLKLEVPLWADVFGDIMAEAQAKAVRSGSDWSIVHFWTLLRGVLEVADCFSAVSVAQAHALVGQLGLAGRLTRNTAGEELVRTIPCATDARSARADRAAARRELGLGCNDFVLLASGGVNTWWDVETFCRGVAIAMEAEPRLRLLVTGGSIPGHDEASYAALVAGLRSIEPSRVRLLGWIDSSRLSGVYAAADLALHVERCLYERRLGAENRVLEWLAHDLPCVTTAQSETGQELVASGLALPSPTGDAEELAAVIVGAARDARLAELGRRGGEWAARERGYAKTAGPLRDWCAAPRFARDHDATRLVRLGLLTHPKTSVEMLEAYVAALPVREVARRGVRWVARRSWQAGRGLLDRGRRWLVRFTCAAARGPGPATLPGHLEPGAVESGGSSPGGVAVEKVFEAR